MNPTSQTSQTRSSQTHPSRRKGRSLSLRAKIYAGFGLLLAVLLMVIALGLYAQHRMLNDFQLSETIGSQSTSLVEIDRRVQELKGRTENFVHTGAQSQLNRAIELRQDLLNEIDELKRSGFSDEMDRRLEAMRRPLESLGEQLDMAAAERKIRYELVQEKLPAQDNRVWQRIERTRLATINQNGVEAAAVAESVSDVLTIQKRFTDARQSLLNYVIEPDSGDFTATLDALDQTTERVEELIQRSESDEIRQAAEALRVSIREYRQLAVRAAQATRGYLFYSDVVMAGGIAEFIYQSSETERWATIQSDRQRERRSRAADRLRQYAVLTSLIGILLALGISTWLSQMIVGPVSALTETFGRLSRGEDVGDIPGVERRDEIGRMSRSAQMFGEANARTQRLLVETERLKDEVENKADALEATNRELDHFAYVASHDLKSPLRGIDNLINFIFEDHEDELSDEPRKHLTMIRSRVARMEQLLNDLLTYSRIGRTAPEPAIVSPDDLLKSATDLLDLPAGFTINLDTSIESMCVVPIPLQQVLMNLITNAVKYNDKGGEGRIDLSIDQTPTHYRFVVADNGIGIDPKFHHKVFEMYQRVAVKMSEGSGMGLAIVKKQIKSFGGEIEIDSYEGEGAKFTFTWQKAQMSNDTKPATSTSPFPSSPAAGGVRVTEPTAHLG